MRFGTSPGVVPSSSIRLLARARRSSPPRRLGGLVGPSSAIRSIATSSSGDGSNTPARRHGLQGRIRPLRRWKPCAFSGRACPPPSAQGVTDMSEKSDPTHGAPLESQANGSQSKPIEDYKVGRGRPPADKRWQKGGPSPNPGGRPRKEQSMLPDVRKAFEQAINKKVSVPRGDKMVLMTRVEIGLEQLLNQFAKGERYARRDLIEYADKLGIDFLAKYKQT